MNVVGLRTRLALATLALIVIILTLFYAAGRYVVVHTVRGAEAEVEQIRLDVQRSVTHDLLELHQLATQLAEQLAGVGTLESSEAATSEDAAFSSVLADLRQEHDLGLILHRRGRDERVLLSPPNGELAGQTATATEEAIRDYLVPGSPLLRSRDFTGACAGLMAIQDKMALVAAAPIGEIETPGDLLLVGRFLDNGPLLEQIGRFRQNFSLQVMIRPKRRIQKRGEFDRLDRIPAVFGVARDYTPGGAWHVGRDAFETSVPLRDLHGDMVGSVSIMLPKSFMDVANELLDKILWVVCGLGSLITLLAFYGFSRAIVSPLRRMIAEIVELAEKRPPRGRLGWRRKDEFGQLARTLDDLLDQLDEDTRALLKQDAETLALFAAVPDVFCVFGTDGVLQSINCGNLGCQPLTDRLKVGATIASAKVSDEVVETFAAMLRQGAKGRASIALIFPGEKAADDLHLECRIVRLDDDRVLAVFRNMTAEHLAQRQMTALEGKLLLLQRHESLGHVVGGIAHDFNNLLSVIRSSLEAHQSAMTQDGGEDEDLQAISQSAKQAAELIRQLQMYAGISDMVFERINLNTLLSNTWALLRASVPHHITLEVEKASHLPDVVADSTQIVQVLSNLLINAAEAIGENPGIIRLSSRLARGVELRREGHAMTREPQADWYAELSVKDNGRGISPTQMNRILEPFFSTKGEGRGLGLAMVAGILESHDGVLSVTSLLGKGTTFRIFLPVSVETQEQEAPVADATAAVTPDQEEGDRLCVLVVEDDVRIRSVLRLLLESLECEVLEAGQEAEARVQMQKHLERIGLLVLDANIRGMDGVRVLRAIRQKAPALPTFLISGHDEASVRRAFAGIPFDGFIPKPFGRDAIAAMLKAVRNPVP